MLMVETFRRDHQWHISLILVVSIRVSLSLDTTRPPRDIMKFDAVLPPTGLNDVPAIAQAAEEIGFDALWTQETQHDPFLPCALIAEHTARLNFGTGIAVSFARSPAN